MSLQSKRNTPLFQLRSFEHEAFYVHSNSSSVTACACAAFSADAPPRSAVPTAASIARLVSMLSTADASTAADASWDASIGSCGALSSEPPADSLDREAPGSCEASPGEGEDR